MTKVNLLVVAGLLLLATACTENAPVVPIHMATEESTSVPVLVIPLDDSVYVNKGKGKPDKRKPEVFGSLYHVDIMPEKIVEEQ
ncbi:hypothetical protein [Spirosoma flavum]|uniref:Uncharacterized protein n=1 Tax=Spirosoma flavum TaxID=2048557 RepID=A0ABW6AJY8_9BACT